MPMAGPWLVAVSTALYLLSVNADVVIGASIAGNLLDIGEHLNARQLSPNGSLTSLLIPIATICSANGSFQTGSAQNGNFQTTSATARLPGGGSTVFATRVRRQNGPSDTPAGAADAAHLVSGTDGCSTLFTPTTYSACSTVVSPIGLPPVTVTECDQYVTFSSETLFMCPPPPTFTPKPASSFQSTRTAGSFTSRPKLSHNGTHANATTTHTPSADSVPTISISTRSISGASGMPMSIPRRFQAEKRQVMFDHNGKPLETEATIIAPGKHLNPRQLMFHRGGGEAITDLTIIAPTTISNKDNGESTTMPIRHTEMASSVTGTKSAVPPSQTTVSVAGPVVTKLTPIPDMLQAKHKRKDLPAAVHDSHADTNAKRLANIPSIPPTLNSTRTNGTRLASKLAKLDTIRLANAAYAAREAQVPNIQNLSPPSPTKFYAAPWSEIINGGIPQHILGITCYGGGEHIGKCTTPDTDGDPEECECVTERQSWSVSSVTETRIGTTIVSYSGPLIVTGPGGAVTTTNVSFLSTMSTTRSFVDSFVVKKTLTGEETVTKTMTSLSSATVSLLAVGDVKAAAPQSAPGGLSSLDEATTVVLTSYVATETVTVPPAEETRDVAGAADGSDLEMVPGVESSADIDVTNVKRDDGDGCQSPDPEDCRWPSDVWLAKLETSGAKADIMSDG